MTESQPTEPNTSHTEFLTHPPSGLFGFSLKTMTWVVAGAVAGAVICVALCPAVAVGAAAVGGAAVLGVSATAVAGSAAAGALAGALVGTAIEGAAASGLPALAIPDFSQYSWNSSDSGGSAGGQDCGNPGTSGSRVRPEVSDPKLRNCVDRLYKHEGGANTVGDGTTMDILPQEVEAGEGQHIQKAQEIVRGLNKWLGNRNGRAASPEDYEAALRMRDELESLLGRFRE